MVTASRSCPPWRMELTRLQFSAADRKNTTAAILMKMSSWFYCFNLKNLNSCFYFIDPEFDDFSGDYECTVYCINKHPATNMLMCLALQPAVVIRLPNLFVIV